MQSFLTHGSSFIKKCSKSNAVNTTHVHFGMFVFLFIQLMIINNIPKGSSTSNEEKVLPQSS